MSVPAKVLTVALAMSAFSLASLSLPGGVSTAEARCDRKCKSAKNKQAAEQYCAERRRAGTSCKVIKARLAGCGKGWIRGRKFGGKGRDYVACVQGAGRTVLANIHPIVQTSVNQECEARKRCNKSCKTRACRNNCRQSCKLEGCAPVAGAMLMSYWQGKGYNKLIIDSGYNGATKPTATIRQLMRKMNAISFGDKGTATPAQFAKAGIKQWVKDRGYKDKLEVERMQALRGHEKIIEQIIKNIDAGYPTIMLINDRQVEIGGRCTKWHYVLAVGYDASNKGHEKILVLNGWEDGSRADTANKMVEVPSYGCGRKLDVGLIWLED